MRGLHVPFYTVSSSQAKAELVIIMTKNVSRCTEVIIVILILLLYAKKMISNFKMTKARRELIFSTRNIKKKHTIRLGRNLMWVDGWQRRVAGHALQ